MEASVSKSAIANNALARCTSDGRFMCREALSFNREDWLCSCRGNATIGFDKSDKEIVLRTVEHCRVRHVAES